MAPSVNPSTGLASDYLNHFHEVLLLLEHVSSHPDLLGDLERWSHRSYESHFADAGSPDRHAVLRAYEAVSTETRLLMEMASADAGYIATQGIRHLLSEARQGRDITISSRQLAEELRNHLGRIARIIQVERR